MFKIEEVLKRESHHHSAGSEESLEVIGQLSATRITRVHGDVHVTVGIDLHVGALEEEALHSRTLGAVNRENLLSDHRQHLHVDAVELVEAAPTAARQPLEELGHL